MVRGHRETSYQAQVTAGRKMNHHELVARQIRDHDERLAKKESRNAAVSGAAGAVVKAAKKISGALDRLMS